MSILAHLIAEHELPADYIDVVEGHWAPLAEHIAQTRPKVVGINGAQGSGKTTATAFLGTLLAERHQLLARVVSLDDFYLTRAERQELAENDHPLFATRGVPGTHDVPLMEAVIDDFLAGRETRLPLFNKALDDRDMDRTIGAIPADVILFEGWCIGAVPQPAAALREPVNALEAKEDADGRWRREVNRRLATDYAELFGRIDLLVMLKVQSWDAVRANRLKQEQKLGDGPAVMDEAALDRFLMHYERLTRWQLEEMPGRADIVIPIGPDQRPI